MGQRPRVARIDGEHRVPACSCRQPRRQRSCTRNFQTTQELPSLGRLPRPTGCSLCCLEFVARTIRSDQSLNRIAISYQSVFKYSSNFSLSCSDS